MNIYIDADASPKVIKEILFRAAQRVCVPLILVANQNMNFPKSDYISGIAVSAGPDEADDRIVELVQPRDLVVTADIPLANRVVDKGAFALDPRGQLYTNDNIKDRLALRDLLDRLRSTGMTTGGPAPFNKKDSQAFANQLNSFLTRHCRD